MDLNCGTGHVMTWVVKQLLLSPEGNVHSWRNHFLVHIIITSYITFDQAPLIVAKYNNDLPDIISTDK